MARKAFLATDAMREQVRSLAARGVRQEDIATLIDCDAAELSASNKANIETGVRSTGCTISSASLS